VRRRNYYISGPLEVDKFACKQDNWRRTSDPRFPSQGHPGLWRGKLRKPPRVDTVRRSEHTRFRVAIMTPIGSVPRTDNECRIKLAQKQRIECILGEALEARSWCLEMAVATDHDRDTEALGSPQSLKETL
jgi:hypothetical protein